MLAQHFLETTCQDFGRKPMKLTRGQADLIRSYDWPGNVRELKNVIERAVILSPGELLRLDLSMPDADVMEAATGVAAVSSEDEIITEKQMRALQKKNIVAALRKSNWRVSGAAGAADLLGVKPTTLADRIRNFGIKKPAS